MPHIVFIGLLLAELLTGCRPPATQNPPSTTPPPDLSRIDLLNDSSGELTDETWSVHRVRGFKMGHQWARNYAFRMGEAPAERTIVVDELLIPRFGTASDQVLRAAVVYDSGGKLLEMEYELQSSAQRRRLVAKVVDSRLFVLRLTDQQRQLSQQDWAPDNGGFFAIERSLAHSPMRPGERRVVRAWLPLVDQPQAFLLAAAASDEVPSTSRLPSGTSAADPASSTSRLPSGTTAAHQVSSTSRLPSGTTAAHQVSNQRISRAASKDTSRPESARPEIVQAVTSTASQQVPSGRRDLLINVTLADQPEDAPVGLRLWVDPSGVIRRRWRRTLDQTTELTDKTTALLPNEPLRFDIALDVRIPFADAAPDTNSATEATYRVRLTDANPLLLIPQGGYQRVSALDDRTATVRVHTDLTERRVDAAASPEPVPDAAAVQANYWLEVKDPAIQRFVRRALGSTGSISSNDESVVERLRLAVAKELRETTLGNTLTTAAGALRAKAGDCTEHAMLLAAACRACQIPARVAVGVIYQLPSESFVYHMWTEAWNGHDWQPIDALGDSAIPPANRIKLLHSDLSSESDYELVAPFSQIIGNMKITRSEQPH